MNLQVRCAHGVDGTIVILAAKCPSCKAEVGVDSFGRCEFCSRLIVNEQTLPAKEMLAQLRPQKMRPDDAAATGRGAALLCALFTLSDRQRYVFIQRAIFERTQQSLADELRTTRQAVSLSEGHALRKLRVALADVRGALAA
jgi:DNA-directed RNA polymerase specialized sigma24 family protein